MHRVLLNVAGAINLVTGCLGFFVFLMFGSDFSDIQLWLPIVILFTSGGIFLYAGNNKNLPKSFNKFVLVSGIASVFSCGMIPGVLGIISYGMLESQGATEKEEFIVKEKKELTPEEKELRRLRNILGLGVGLVVLAGLIFATSTWETLNGFSKTIILILAAFLFYLVSALAENKLRLKVSGMMYYLLSNVLIVVSLVSAGYFEVFGKWFSLSGGGNNLFATVIWVVVVFFSYVAYIKYDIKNILYLVYFSVLNIVYFGVLAIFNFREISFLLVLIVGAIGCFINRKDSCFSMFNKFCKVALPIIAIIWLANLMDGNTKMLFDLIYFGIFSVTFYCLALIEEDEFFKFFAPIITVCSAIYICTTGYVPLKVMLIQISGIVTIIYALGIYKKESKIFYNVSAVISNLVWIYVVFGSIDVGFYGLAVATSLMMFATSVIVNLDRNSGKFHFEKFVEPVKIFVLAYALDSLLNSFEGVANFDFAIVMSVIFLIMYLVRKDWFKFVYFILCCYMTLIVFFGSFEDFAIISNITAILVPTVLLISACLSDDKKYINCKEAIYAVILLAIYSLFSGCIKEYTEFSWWFILAMTLSYAVVFLVVSKNNIMKLMTVLAVFIPYGLAVDKFMNLYINENNFEVIRSVKHILTSIPGFVAIIVYTRGFLRSVSWSSVKIVEIVALSIWYLVLLTRTSAEIGLFIGIVALVSILIGYKSERYVSFYYTGIGFTIINLLVQLKDVWSIIPIWVYIFLSGLILIGIVTYKEYVRINPKVEEVVPDVVDSESNEVKKLPVDSRAVIVGSIICGIILIVSIV